MPNPQKKSNGPKLSIILETGDPVKIGSGWLISIIVTVLFSKKYPPEPPREVIFFLGTEEIGSEHTNEETGRCSLTVPITSSGGHLITVCLADMPGIRKSKMVVIIKEITNQKATEIVVVHETEIPDGYSLDLQVFDEKENPVSGAIIRVFDQGLSTGFVDLTPTDKWGNAQHKAIFAPREKEKILTFSILGTKIDGWVNLFR
ncbi:hypothetical protein HY227_01485 [Candidatus Wolfebacteria bacterium]|nr:hypothetical protein [Candidatus Wolfebacteria bacterium]